MVSRWRPEVEAFADLMEAQLRANDHKGGWKACDPHWLHDRLLEEAAELQDAGQWKTDGGPSQGGYGRAVAREAADVANFAMMIADVCGGLETPTPAAGQESPVGSAAVQGGQSSNGTNQTPNQEVAP